MIQKKSVVIYTGVDNSLISQNTNLSGLRKKYKISSNDLLIGIFSRIEPWKGQDIVVKSMPKVLSKLNNVKLFVFGIPYTKRGKNYKKYLENFVKVHKLENSILFPGLVKNLEKVYSEFDIIILPSIDPEPFSRVIIESMAAARSVIATNIGGNPESIVNNKTGLLIKPKNVKEMENAIITLASNKELREKFGKSARKNAEEYFDIRKCVKQIEEVYKKMK